MKTFQVGKGADAIMTYPTKIEPRGEAVGQLVSHLNTIPDLKNFVVLPEGIMLNFLTRIPSNNKYVNFMPPEMLLYGEETIMTSLTDKPPQYIILAHKDTSEYGFDFFGREASYGMLILSWIEAQYEPVLQIMAEPLIGKEFGIKLLRLNK
jgi:hypothetical protein